MRKMETSGESQMPSVTKHSVWHEDKMNAGTWGQIQVLSTGRLLGHPTKVDAPGCHQDELPEKKGSVLPGCAAGANLCVCSSVVCEWLRPGVCAVLAEEESLSASAASWCFWLSF